MRAEQTFLLIAFVACIALLASVAPSMTPIRPMGANPNRVSFGSRGVGTEGWLLPADTLVSTTYTANRTLTGFVEGILNVYPYHILSGTTIYLSLYLNGRLVATTEYDSPFNYKIAASPVGDSASGAANFTDSMLVFNVSQLDLSNSLPTGTTMTVTAWTNKPVWAQIDNTSLVPSYETFGLINYSPPPTIDTSSGVVAPYSLAVGFETNG